MLLLEVILTWAQVAVLLPLAVLGLHRGAQVLVSWRHRHRAPQRIRARAAAPAAEPAAGWPAVTVQLPLYNERFVAARLIAAVAALDYPRDRLEIQVLDDSTDDTSEVVAAALARLPGDLRVAHVRRGTRRGFKAGALAEGLRAARGTLVAIFDADFVPQSGFLKQLVPEFDDPAVGLVQARWEHLNRDHGLLARMQALLLDGHFAVEHVARARSGCFFNFNGTAGVFRRTAIDAAGGWQGDTLTEDLDLSYRAQLAGWRFVYRPDVGCPAELPVDANAFLNQQHRWAKGGLQTARKLLPILWDAPLPGRVRREATVHLLANLAFPLLLGLILLALPLAALRYLNASFPPLWLAVLEGVPLVAATAAVLTYYGTAARRLGRLGPGTLLRLPLVLAVGAGLVVNNTAAVVAGLGRRTGVFERTPKLAHGQAPCAGSKAHYRPTRGLRPLLELGLGAWAASTAVVSTWIDLPATAAFHGLFAVGLWWIGGASLASEVQRLALRARASGDAAAGGDAGAVRGCVQAPEGL